MRIDGVPKNSVMTGERLAHRVAMSLNEAHRPFDVGEHERHGTGRQGAHRFVAGHMICERLPSHGRSRRVNSEGAAFAQRFLYDPGSVSARPGFPTDRSLPGTCVLDHDVRTDRRTASSSLLQLLLRRPSGSGLAHWLHSFSLHVITGFAAVAAHYALMYALIRAGLAPVPASAIGFLAGALTRFVLSYAHIFAPTRGVQAAGVRFVVAIAAQLAANSALLAALTESGMRVWPAQILTTILLTVVNYLVYRWWVFR